MAPNLLPGAPSVVAEAPQNKVGADAFSRAPTFVPEQSLASGLEQFSAGLENLAVPLAKKAGEQDAAAAVAAAAGQLGTPVGAAGASSQPAGQPGQPSTDKGVGLDASGLPQVFTPANNFILGRAGEAYQAASAAGTEAGLSSVLSENLTNIHVQHQGDPDGFSAAANSYAEYWRQNYPGQVGTDLANQVHSLAAQHYAVLSNQKAALGLEGDKNALLTQISDTTSKMEVLARNGGIATQDYAAYQSQLTGAYAKLGGNPLFGYGPERAQSELNDALSTGRAQYTIGQVDSVFNKSGKAAAQQMLTNGILNNEDLHLPIDERTKLAAYGMAHLDYLTSAQKIQIDASRETTAPLLEQMRTNPAGVTPQMVNQGLALAQKANDSESVLKLTWAQAHASDRAAMQGLTDQQRVLAATGGAAAGGSTPGGYLGALGRAENNTGNPNAGNGGGTYQFEPGTWTGLMQKHPELNLTADGRNDPAQGARAVVALTNDNRDALQNAGIAPTDANTRMAHFLGAGGATSFIKAMNADPNAPAAGVALAAATNNPTIFYKPGANGQPDPTQPRSLGEVYALQTKGFGGGTSPVAAPGSAGAPGAAGAPTDAQVAANPYALSMYLATQRAGTEQDIKSARNVGETLISQYAKGVTPPAYVTAATLQLADKYPDQLGEQAQKIRNLAAGADIGSAINSDPTPAAREGHLSQVEAWMRSGDLNDMAKAEEAKLFMSQGAKALKEDPWNELVRRRILVAPPTPPDLQTPEGMAALPKSLAEHAQAAVALSSFNGVPAPLFSPAEMPAMKSAFQNGPVDVKVGLAQALFNTRVRPDVMQETFRQLGADPTTSPLAVAGDVARYDPSTAHSIVMGHAQLAAEPKLAPKDPIGEKFAELLPFNDLEDGVTRQAYQSAASALYANKSAMASPPDTSGILDEGRLKDALEGVTGGIREWRGSKVFSPWPGATQDQLDGAIRSVKDSDLADAVGSDGVPLKASALLPSLSGVFSSNSRFRLESTGGGDGKYLIFSGPDQHDQRQYLLDKTTKQRFVLDLNAKKAEAIARANGPLSHTPFSDSAGSEFLTRTVPVGFQ